MAASRGKTGGCGVDEALPRDDAAEASVTFAAEAETKDVENSARPPSLANDNYHDELNYEMQTETNLR